MSAANARTKAVVRTLLATDAAVSAEQARLIMEILDGRAPRTAVADGLPRCRSRGSSPTGSSGRSCMRRTCTGVRRTSTGIWTMSGGGVEMSERPVRIGETRFMSFFEYLARFGKDPRFVSVPTVALAICQARMSGFSREEREDCLAGRGVGREIVSEAEAWLSRRCGTLRVTGPERLFVRRMIEAGHRWSGSEGIRLEAVSPVAMGRDADRQRRLLLETLHADWRGLPIEDEIDQRNVPINQLSSGGVSLLNCRHALLVFPAMSLRDQYLFFLGKEKGPAGSIRRGL